MITNIIQQYFNISFRNTLLIGFGPLATSKVKGEIKDFVH